jgi:hypothetical protein
MKKAPMDYGRFTLLDLDGTGGDFPVLTAVVSISEAGGDWWLSIFASTTPPDWTCPLAGDIPVLPAIEVSARVAGPEEAAWGSRELALPEGRDPRTGCYPAWLYTTGGYETLVGCVVMGGHRIGERVAVRVVARGSSSGCDIRVVGDLPLEIVSAREAKPRAVANGPRE